MTRSPERSKYQILQEEINKAIPTSDLPKIKQFVSYRINSRRFLSQIKNLSDIFFILERRRALHENDVSALQCLGEYLGNSQVVELCQAYTKLEVEPQSCVCGSSEPCFKEPDLTTHASDIDINLQKAMNNLASNIEGKWKILARELDVRECYIDEISQTYQTTYYQAMKALTLWKTSLRDEATEEALKKALESRISKMHGLGVHLLEKSLSVELI